MYTTYHLASANEISSDIIDAIKLAFKDKSIVLTIEEEIDTTSYLLSSKKNKDSIQKSLLQDKNNDHIKVKLQDL
ncbi:hypothetical protein [Flavobacterium sp.]|uniref:hypothetical protein n=1 Tax=Flavobacterium sp. TaxID=239 RepID=UPI003753769A